jgi:hypothetical protein
MMLGEVEIVNLALARLGESPIQTLDEGSAPANSAKMLYPSEKKAVLRDYNWGFALRVKTLARLAEEPIGFRFAYALPADCLRVVRVWERSTQCLVSHDTRGKTLLTDADGELCVEYVADIEDASLFDSKFVEALVYKLASALAMPVKGSAELMANYANMYQAIVSQAATLTARESGVHLSENPYVEARL